ncbi:MAG: VTT domain-containing protein [bacterium]
MHSTTQTLITELGAMSYLGIFFVALISNIVIPVPEEVMVIIFGYLAGGMVVNGTLLFPVILLGLLASDIIMYLFSKRGNKLVSGFYDKVFAKRVESKKEWIDKNINKVVFFARFLVQLRFLGPFFAGQTKMSFRRFFFLDLAALLVYVSIYYAVGFYFRSRINFIISGVNLAKNIIILVVVAIVLASLVQYVRRRLLKIKTESDINVQGK